MCFMFMAVSLFSCFIVHVMLDLCFWLVSLIVFGLSMLLGCDVFVCLLCASHLCLSGLFRVSWLFFVVVCLGSASPWSHSAVLLLGVLRFVRASLCAHSQSKESSVPKHDKQNRSDNNIASFTTKAIKHCFASKGETSGAAK